MPPKPTDEFPKGVGAPATRALHEAGYTELKQLANVPAAELKKLHGMGPKAGGCVVGCLAGQQGVAKPESLCDPWARVSHSQAG